MALAHREARQWAPSLLLVTALAFVAGGAIDLAYTWRQSEAQIASLQREKAEAAAAQIERLLAAVQDKLAWSMDPAAGSPEQRRADSLRLLRQVPEVTEVAQLDADGKELMWVSRLARDRIAEGIDYANDPRYVEARKRKSYVGPVQFRKASEPYVSLALAHRVNGGVVLAEVSLRGVTDAIRAVRLGETGYAYVVDGSGRLVAGPDAPAERPHDTGLTGVPVLSAQAAVPTPGWRVFVEWPVAEARQPLWSALLRGACVLGLGLASVLLAGVAARRRTPEETRRSEGLAPS